MAELTSPTDATRVLVVADDPLVRTGLAVVLALQPGLSVAGQVSSRDDVGSAVGALSPDVLLWDLGGETRSAGDRLAPATQWRVPSVVLAADETSASDALIAGATGVLARNAEGPTLTVTLRAVAAGLMVLDPSLPSVLPSRERAVARASEELTARELEVLQLLSLGLANKVIAQRLGISDHTVKFHVNAILNKLGAQSRTEAVVQAARLGLVIL